MDEMKIKQIWCNMDEMKKKLDARRTKWKKKYLMPDGQNEKKIWCHIDEMKKKLMSDERNEKKKWCQMDEKKKKIDAW